MLFVVDAVEIKLDLIDSEKIYSFIIIINVVIISAVAIAIIASRICSSDGSESSTGDVDTFYLLSAM